MKMSLRHVTSALICVVLGSYQVAAAETLSIDNGELTLKVPESWQVAEGDLGMRAILYAPKKKPSLYDGNISIQRFAKPKYLTSNNIKAMSSVLKKRIAAKEGIESIKWRQPRLKVRNNPGLKAERAGIFKVSFIQNKIPLTQMYYLVSSEKRSYLLTYTEASQSIAADRESFKEAWGIISQSQLKSKAKAPVDKIPYLIAGVLLFVALMVVTYLRRKTSEARMLENSNKYRDDDHSSLPLTESGIYTDLSASFDVTDATAI